jgi:hypothetical protein
MKNTVFGTWSDGRKFIDVNIHIIVFKEGESHIVYCPALNLTGYGNTEQEASDSFNTVLDEYFIYTNNKNSLGKDLEKMGWKIKKSLKKPATPPAMSYMLLNNVDFKNIFDNYDFKKVNTSVSIPAFS